jgi:predicted RecA/RadA family phage recombinase
MITEAQVYKQGAALDHTPVAALVAGQVIKVGGLAAIAQTAIAAAAQGSVVIEGLVKVRNTATAGNLGDNVWWDENGTGVDTNTGACSTNAAVGDFWIGTLAAALAATDTYAIVALNKVNPELPHWPNRTHVKKTADYTVDATNYGGVVHCDGSGESDDIIVITLPATVAGMEVTIQNDAADGASQITVEVNGSDKILNPTALDDGDTLDNTLATAVRGDFVTFVGDGANGWIIKDKRGTWADGGAT